MTRPSESLHEKWRKGPFPADDLAECDRRFGAAPPPSSSQPLPPDPALPLPPLSFVGTRVGYGGALPPLRFKVRAGVYIARDEMIRNASMDAVFRAVEKAFSVSRLDLVSHRRLRAQAIPRFALCLLATEFTEWSLVRIGMSLGGRDHTTVLHAIRRAHLLEAHDETFAAALGSARAALRDEVAPNEVDP